MNNPIDKVKELFEKVHNGIKFDSFGKITAKIKPENLVNKKIILRMLMKVKRPKTF